MRVLVATDRIGQLSSLRVGECFARAWAGLGAECAVVPIGEAGAGFVEAAADQWETTLEVIAASETLPVTVAVQPREDGTTVAPRAGDPGATRIAVSVPRRPTDPWLGDSGDLGLALAAVLTAISVRPLDVYLDLTANLSHDGGRALFEQAAELDLTGVQLTGVVPADEMTTPLTGLRGIVSRDGRPAGLDVEELLSRDQALVDWAADLTARVDFPTPLADEPGAGACGGAGVAILGLGGTVVAGSELLSDRADLLSTMRACDLVVTGCAQLDFGTMGGQALRRVVTLAEQALRPAIALAGTNYISERELRSVGIEQAYSLLGDDTEQAYSLLEGRDPDDLGDDLPDLLTDAAARIARSWVW